LNGFRQVAGLWGTCDRSNEAIATARQSLDKPGVISCISQDIPQPVHCFVQIVIEIHVGICRPEFVAQLIAADQFSSVVQQDEQNPKRLLLQPDLYASPAQFSQLPVGLKNAEAQHA
jgi:hypothetical protein